MDQALAGVRVLDLSQHISGPYCTKLLADHGAEVIKVERPSGGDVARRMGPFPDDRPHPERSGLFLYLNTNKKSVTLDITTSTGRKIIEELVRSSDVLVENFGPGLMERLGLGYEALQAINPRLVFTSITDFGQYGPYSNYKGASIVSYALSGHMYTNGAPDREPLQGAGPQPEYQGGLHGFLGTLAALHSREDTGAGQFVDVSILEAMVGFHRETITQYTYNHEIRGRYGNRSSGQPLVNILQCKDGYIALATPLRLQQEFLFTLMEKTELIEDPRFLTREDSAENADALESIILSWFKARTRDEIFHACSEWRIPCAPVAGPEDLLDDPHYKAREYWVDVEHPEAGRLTYPGAPFKMSETPWRAGRAPLLGEHNEEVYCGRLGYSREDLVRLRETGAI